MVYVYIYRRDTLVKSEYTRTLNLHTSMLTTAFLLLSLVSVVTPYFSNFNKRQLYRCPRGKSIVSWQSYHSNRHEDRRYRFTCQTTRGLGKCRWSGCANQFDKPLSFRCPNNGVISGVSSYHSNRYEDRRFKFYCCSLRYRHLSHCGKTGYLNRWDKKLNFKLPAAHVLKGVFSIHHNYYDFFRNLEINMGVKVLVILLKVRVMLLAVALERQALAI